MVTLEDLGITTFLPDFCKECKVNGLFLDSETRYASDEIYERNHNVTCRYLGLCTNFYERMKKEVNNGNA